MQISTSMNNLMPVHHVNPTNPDNDFGSQINNLLTPEQQLTMQRGIDDKMTEQVDNIKSNYQTAKDTDLMQAYYQQQQKLLDIYVQSSTGNSSSSTTTNDTQSTSAVSTLTNTYTDLYQLHQKVKDGVGQLPSIELPIGDAEILPVSTMSQTNENSLSTMNQNLSHKQLDAYNSLMTPSSSSYVHLSA